MDNTTKKDIKFTASIFLTIGFHAVLWWLIRFYCTWAGIKDAGEAALCIVLLLSIGTGPFMVSVLEDWVNS